MTLSPLQQLALSRGIALPDLSAPSAASDVKEVPYGPEMRRILALERRPPPADTEEAQKMAIFLTEKLARHPNPYPVGPEYGDGNGYLSPLQAASLHDGWASPLGAFLPVPAGYGKTLIAYLWFSIKGAKKPLYMAPKGLLGQAKTEFKLYHKHWKGIDPSRIEYLQYELLSRDSAGVQLDENKRIVQKALLDRLGVDAVFCDEAHCLKRRSSSRYKKFRDWRNTHREVPIVFATGTPGIEVNETSHMLVWCLGEDKSPLPSPKHFHEEQAWVAAVSTKNSFMGNEVAIGALEKLCDEEEREQLRTVDELAAKQIARFAIGRRVRETKGVVGISGGELDLPITIEAVFPEKEDPKINEFFVAVRTRQMLPDDDDLVDGVAVARAANTGGCGFWIRITDPKPPKWWFDARRTWHSAARDYIEHNHSGIYSEDSLKRAIRKGAVKQGKHELAAWEEAIKAYGREPITEEVPFSDEPLIYAAQWAKDHPRGIIWVYHKKFGARVAEAVGTSFYEELGLDSRGKYIADHPHGMPMVASISANATGRNLQHGWNENLWLGCTPHEQALARTHRRGQKYPVTNYLYLGCREHLCRYYSAVETSLKDQLNNHSARRLQYAVSSVPQVDEVEKRGGARWTR